MVKSHRGRWKIKVPQGPIKLPHLPGGGRILCMTSNKWQIVADQQQMIADLQQNGATTQHICYWPDGPSSQFKNKFNAKNLKFHFHDYGISADWNFFGTAHGKGENDGSGGDVKNGVWCEVLQKRQWLQIQMIL